MKKENVCKFLYIVSTFLIIVFTIKLGLDYFNYDTINNSAPFYIFILIRVLEFIVPSIIIFIIARMLNKKLVK